MSSNNRPKSLITVICPVYNTRKYFRRCIDSVLAQTFTDYKLLIIDDGSTDGCSQIADEYAKLNSTVRVIHQSNKGLSACRNLGIREAKTDLIYFIDSDDYIHPRTLEILYSNLIEYDADIAIGGIARNTELPEVLENNCTVLSKMKALHIIVDSVLSDYVNRDFLPVCVTWNKLYKKSIFANITFVEGRLHEDNSTVHRILYNAEKLVMTSAQTYSYTQNRNGIVARGLSDLDMVAAYEDRIKFFTEVELYELLPLTYQRYEAVLKATYDRLKDPTLIEKLESLADVQIPTKPAADQSSECTPYEASKSLDLKKYKSIGLYVKALRFYNGVTSWIYNFANGLYNDYHIVLYTECISLKLRHQFEHIISVVKLDPEAEYECDVLINNSIMTPLPESIHYKDRFNIIHCDYAHFYDSNEIDLDPKQKYIAVSSEVAKNSELTFGIKCDTIEGLFVQRPRRMRHKVLHLVSATRFTPYKGFANFAALATRLKDAGILFEWRLYCDNDTGLQPDSIPCPEMVKLPAVSNNVLMNYLADADYVIQLSDSEGFGMIVHEALMVGTPVIVSDTPVFTKYVTNGVNGYIVPHNIDEFDVNVLHEIPRSFVYPSKFEEIHSKWCSLLGKKEEE